MDYVIRLIRRADGVPSPGFDGKFVVRFYDTGRRGVLIVDDDPQRARRFHAKHAAVHYWQKQSRRRPLLPNGEPNRPLQAFVAAIGLAPEPDLDAWWREDGV
jgi:hypothetical protein